MEQEKILTRQHGNAYNIFILVLTIFSLIIMVVLFLPLNDATIGLLQFYDILICIIFLIDFFINLRAAPSKSNFFIKERGWLDLLGAVPTFGMAFKYSGLLRLARLNRAVRIARIIRGEKRGALIADVIKNRSNYAAGITILLTLIILSSSSVLVLQFESASSDALITTGWDAFWYSMVTITTVGYGDFYPVTFWGRVTAMFVMVAGVGIIGALASLLSSLLIGSRPTHLQENGPDTSIPPLVEDELTAIKIELAELRKILENKSPGDGPG